MLLFCSSSLNLEGRESYPKVQGGPNMWYWTEQIDDTASSLLVRYTHSLGEDTTYHAPHTGCMQSEAAGPLGGWLCSKERVG